jgi:hypothetical protein
VNGTDPADNYENVIRRASWKVDVVDRLCEVEEDLARAVGAAGWTLIPRDNNSPEISFRTSGTQEAATQDDASIRLMSEAQAVVDTTYRYIGKTKITLNRLPKLRQRFWDSLTGELLMSAYVNLHAAESNRVLLLSSDQLTAILPSIRKRATAFLPANDPNSDALKTIPDPTQPAHQAVATRVQPKAAPPPAVPPKAPAQGHDAPPGPHPGSGPTQPPPSGTPDQPPPGSTLTQPPPGGTPDQPPPGGGPDQPPTGPSQPVEQGQPADPNAGQDKNPPAAQGGAQSPPPPPSGNGGNNGNNVPPAGTIVLSDMLGPDQQVAAAVMTAACRAEDQQQLQVRHFRGVLYGASAVLLVAVAVLWIVGAIHPGYFPLCWPVSGSKPATMICPDGGKSPSVADVPLVLGLGALGAALSVALNLTGLKPAGVRFSLTVAQGLNKVVLGAITAVLGIIILRTVTSAPGFLGTQPGLLTTAVIFGYSQQVFTGVIDRQANQLVNAASPATPAATPAASP